MAISLYDLNLRQWVNTNPVEQSSAAALQRILVNVYIEMRLHSAYLEAICNGKTITDDPQALRVDITQDWPVNG